MSKKIPTEEAEYTTHIYPGQFTLDTSTAPTYRWKKVLRVSFAQSDSVIWPTTFKFHPRKQTLDIHKPDNFDNAVLTVRVLVEQYKS